MPQKKEEKTVRLEQWSTSRAYSAFTAPEVNPLLLSGRAYGHPGFEEGASITSSQVVKVEGRKVSTINGTIYMLGRPAPAYMQWLRENKIKYNSRQPIKIVPREKSK